MAALAVLGLGSRSWEPLDSPHGETGAVDDLKIKDRIPGVDERW
ncbi:hypothetical protein ABZ754_00225 [Micromonospora purpureochromogenes]